MRTGDPLEPGEEPGDPLAAGEEVGGTLEPGETGGFCGNAAAGTDTSSRPASNCRALSRRTRSGPLTLSSGPPLALERRATPGGRLHKSPVLNLVPGGENASSAEAPRPARGGCGDFPPAGRRRRGPDSPPTRARAARVRAGRDPVRPGSAPARSGGSPVRADSAPSGALPRARSGAPRGRRRRSPRAPAVLPCARPERGGPERRAPQVPLL